MVVGGGPAGAAAASVLAQGSIRVLLIEALSTVPFKIGETLPPSAKPLLRDLGVGTDRLIGISLPCPGNVAVWGSGEERETPFVRGVHGSGWHLDRPEFDAMLRDQACRAGAAFRHSCRLARWEFDPSLSRWDLELSQGGKRVLASARWLLDATGRRALIATSQGVPSLERDKLVAFCTVAEAEKGDLDGRTWTESAKDGWWYSALLPAGRRMLTFLTDRDLPAASQASNPEGFLQLLGTTRKMRSFAAERQMTRIRRFPAASQSRKTFSGDGWIALGDATLAFDPLSSQGIFHALYTGIRGGQAVASALNDDIFSLAHWNERIVAIEVAYRRNLAACYGDEMRWPEAAFWSRRHSSSVEPPATPDFGGHLGRNRLTMREKASVPGISD